MNDTVLVLSYSDRTAMDIARRIRREQVCSVLLPGATGIEALRAYGAKGIILCGAQDGCTVMDPEILSLGVPVLALGHASQAMLRAMGGAGVCTGTIRREVDVHFEESPLFYGAQDCEQTILVGQTLMLPGNVRMTASGGGNTLAFEDADRALYGLLFELGSGDPTAKTILLNFLFQVCGCANDYGIEEAMAQIEGNLGEMASKGHYAVCAVSGGVDSVVLGKLAKRAFGERMRAVYLDTGLMREDEGALVKETFEGMDIPLTSVDCKPATLQALSGKRSLQEKQTAISNLLLEQLQALEIEHACYLFGTDYGDRFFERMPQPQGEGMVLEPLVQSFRWEVSRMAELLGIPEEVVARKPFPALGLGALLSDEVTPERLALLRDVHRIFSEELESAGMLPKLYEFYPMLTEEGFGGGRQVLLCATTRSGSTLMPARLSYDLVERLTARILDAHPTIGRLLIDKTPALRGTL